MPVELSDKAFIAQRISIVKPDHLGGLGIRGMPILKVQELLALPPGIGKEVGEGIKVLPLISKNFEILSGSCGASVHGLVKITLTWKL